MLKLRIGLTLAALVGLMPATLVCVLGTLVGLIPMLLFSGPSLAAMVWVASIVGLSVVSLWSGWAIYARAMATVPSLRQPWRLLVGTLVSVAWGALLQRQLGDSLGMPLPVLVMPGITAGLMLAILFWRTRGHPRQGR